MPAHRAAAAPGRGAPIGCTLRPSLRHGRQRPLSRLASPSRLAAGHAPLRRGLLVLAAWHARHRAAGARPLLSLFGPRPGLAWGSLDQGRAAILDLLVVVELVVVLVLAALGLGLRRDILEGELALAAFALDQHAHGAAVLQLAKQELVGQWLLDVLLDHPRQR